MRIRLDVTLETIEIIAHCRLNGLYVQQIMTYPITLTHQRI